MVNYNNFAQNNTTRGFQFNFTITNVNNIPDLSIHITLRVLILTFTCVKIDIFITSTLISLNVNLNLTCKTVLLKISQLDQYLGKILKRKIVNFRMIWFFEVFLSWLYWVWIPSGAKNIVKNFIFAFDRKLVYKSFEFWSILIG